MPSGRLVPPGIGLQVDGGKAQKLDYVLCFPDRCIAEAALSDQLVASFKKGTVIDADLGELPEPAEPGKGVADRASPAPMTARRCRSPTSRTAQKQMQDFVAKNNEDFQKKLKAEQEKAKAAN